MRIVNVQTEITMSLRSLLYLPLLLAFLAGCEQQAKLVYVPDGPLTVTLIPSASADRVKQGETVALNVQRRTSGQWKQVPLTEARGQCWFHARPPEFESEVAAIVRWTVEPENSVAFDTDYRFDRVRLATMNVKGTIRLTPVSDVPCEPDHLAQGPTLEIEVE